MIVNATVKIGTKRTQNEHPTTNEEKTTGNIILPHTTNSKQHTKLKKKLPNLLYTTTTSDKKNKLD